VITLKNRLIALVVLVSLTSIAASLGFSAKAQSFPEYERCVHTYLDSGVLGNWTYVEKPMFPVFLNDSQVQIGKNWSVVCPLRVNHSYHVYCYGEWVDWDWEPQTDYDVYVYDPFGEMEGYHTESAGFPEHLGTTVDEAFFVPKYSGNYTFVVENDPRESNSSQQATFMIIENVECNVWHEHYVEGKENDLPVLETSWAYEFVTENQHIEVVIKVPDSLDMYEARLYLMANPQEDMGSILNDVPFAWEPGLYGERDDMFGGYNLESREYRGLAYASCEFHGQDMFVNFTSPYAGKSLYHMVFIGEVGSGTIEFLVKTEFGSACLKPSIVPERVYSYNDTVVAFVSNSTDLKNVTLRCSTNNWENATALEMEILNKRTCTGVVPGQAAGTFVSYRVEANDVLENVLVACGNYSVKHPSVLNLTVISEAVYLGENITVKGCLTPSAERLPVTVCFTSANESKQIMCYTLANGTFTASFKPETIESWKVEAKFSEDEFRYDSLSSQLTIRVEEMPLLVKYSLYIGGGIGAIAIIGVIIYWRKSRG
jgi:hypothetical protein